MNITLDELILLIQDKMDPEDLLSVLDLTTEDLCENFPDQILEAKTELLDYLGLLS